MGPSSGLETRKWVLEEGPEQLVRHVTDIKKNILLRGVQSKVVLNHPIE